MNVHITNSRVVKACILGLALLGVGGSFMLSITGNTPCVYCWIARISMIVVAILAASSLYYDSLWVVGGITLVSIPALVASSILVRNDYFPSPICTGNVECLSPIFMGFHVSLYALFLSLLILAGSILLIYQSVREKP